MQKKTLKDWKHYFDQTLVETYIPYEFTQGKDFEKLEEAGIYNEEMKPS